MGMAASPFFAVVGAQMASEFWAAHGYSTCTMSENPVSPSAIAARKSEPVVGVIYNPRSHRNKGQDLIVAGKANIFVVQPEQRSDIADALRQLKARGMDFLIINGGDGTVRDVLTCGQAVFGDNWPEVAVLPKGKTNALNVDLGAPANWNLADAIAAWPAGQRIVRRPVSITPMEDAAADPSSANLAECDGPLLGFILGGGAFTIGVQAGQNAHKLGAFNSLAVAATSVWGMLRVVLGSNKNPWRRGSPMQFLLGRERVALPYLGTSKPSRRALFLASTLERFPAGMKLFDPAHRGLKLMALDRPRRRVLALVPVILAGWVPDWLRRSGFHQVAAAEFVLEIGEPFILDGEAYPAGTYHVSEGPALSFVVP